MTANANLLPAAVLTVASVVSLGLLSLMCLRCKRKNKTIHEERQVYSQQTFQRGGSKFVVTESKPVTRGFPTTVDTLKLKFPRDSRVGQRISSSTDDDYIAPIETAVYENEKRRVQPPVESPGVYGNIFTPLPTPDDDDYENSEFLEEVKKQEEDNEPDYVNQEST
ncbi:unnamed protein product [Ophioblennius macclurei]